MSNNVLFCYCFHMCSAPLLLLTMKRILLIASVSYLNCKTFKNQLSWTERSNQSILKEISPGCSLEGLMLKLKLQCFVDTWWEEVTHLKRPWCWERLKVGREGDDRGWDSWMASQTQWTWVWASSGSWWWMGVVTKSWTRLSNWTESLHSCCN